METSSLCRIALLNRSSTLLSQRCFSNWEISSKHCFPQLAASMMRWRQQEWVSVLGHRAPTCTSNNNWHFSRLWHLFCKHYCCIFLGETSEKSLDWGVSPKTVKDIQVLYNEFADMQMQPQSWFSPKCVFGKKEKYCRCVKSILHQLYF